MLKLSNNSHSKSYPQLRTDFQPIGKLSRDIDKRRNPERPSEPSRLWVCLEGTHFMCSAAATVFGAPLQPSRSSFLSQRGWMEAGTVEVQKTQTLHPVCLKRLSRNGSRDIWSRSWSRREDRAILWARRELRQHLMSGRPILLNVYDSISVKLLS